MDRNLQCAANIFPLATLIITAAAAAVDLWGYFSYRFELFRKRRRLEEYGYRTPYRIRLLRRAGGESRDNVV